MDFFRKLRKNKGDADQVFFCWGIALTLLLLWFAMDLINLTWSRYTVKREAQNVARIYGVTWVDSVWDPNCTNTLMSSCEYGDLNTSAMSKSMKKMIESAVANGKFTEMTIMISTNNTDTLDNCNGALLCVKNKNGTTTIRGWSPYMVKTRLDYGTDLYLTMTATAPYRYVGKRLGLRDVNYQVQMKFASERFAKDV